MPKRKKQNQQQLPPPQQPPLPERGETGEEEDGSPIGPPSLLGPPPMANGKPGDPKSRSSRIKGTNDSTTAEPPTSSQGQRPNRGGLGPRCGPYGRGWWGANTEPPFPGPGHGGPSRGGFHKEQRNPRRLKNKSNRPVCRHFAKKGHCRYEDLCAFYHPGVNGPPL
ncbi:unnamed protein product [Nyctereutes procyonoides]|uniref:Proline-rich protein 3 n=1 Tax=Nyctereutes procyonoides TaxID=34880 RepID=A0A811ZBB7_NYCPR|nr:unnamed protein product [Nyctereutes procyonoides]